MNHYSDIGFEINNQEDEKKFFSLFLDGKGGPGRVWNITEDVTYYLFKAGDIRYALKLDNKSYTILNLSFSHDNKEISEVEYDKLSSVDTSQTFGWDFPTIEVAKDDIPFWFSCINYDLFKLNPKSKLRIKIASFANSIKIKEPSSVQPIDKEFDPEETRKKAIENINKNGLELADEGYIGYWQDNPCYAMVSGVITNFKLNENPITKSKYYTIGAKCLGLNFNFLVDPVIVDEKILKVGNVISGEFWNTAIIVDDLNKELF